MYYSGWYEPFRPASPSGQARRRATGADRARHQARLDRGREYDGYLSSSPRPSGLHRPVILSFGHEMNGIVVRVGQQAHRARGVRGRLAAHRHAVPRHRRRERDLAVDGQHHRQQTADSRPGPWWPGSAYVTWVGIDGYYLKAPWTFAPLFGPTIGSGRQLTRPRSSSPRRVRAHAGQPGRSPTCSPASVPTGCSDSSGSTPSECRTGGLTTPAEYTAFRQAAKSYKATGVMTHATDRPGHRVPGHHARRVPGREPGSRCSAWTLTRPR